MFRKNQSIELQIILGSVIVLLTAFYFGSRNNVAASPVDAQPGIAPITPNEHEAPSSNASAATPANSSAPTIDLRVSVLCPADLPQTSCSFPAAHMRSLNINTVPQSVPKWGTINVLDEGQAQVNISFPDSTELQFSIVIDPKKIPYPSPGIFLTPNSLSQTCSGTVNIQQSSTCILTFEYVKEG